MHSDTSPPDLKVASSRFIQELRVTQQRASHLFFTPQLHPFSTTLPQDKMVHQSLVFGHQTAGSLAPGALPCHVVDGRWEGGTIETQDFSRKLGARLLTIA